MPERIIAVFHSREPGPGKVADGLAARGFELDGRRPCYGETLPENLSAYAAAIVGAADPIGTLSAAARG